MLEVPDALFVFEWVRIFETPVDSITDCQLIERAWIPGKIVEQICLTRKRKDWKRRFYFSMKKIQSWKDEIDHVLLAAAGKKDG